MHFGWAVCVPDCGVCVWNGTCTFWCPHFSSSNVSKNLAISFRFEFRNVPVTAATHILIGKSISQVRELEVAQGIMAVSFDLNSI